MQIVNRNVLVLVIFLVISFSFNLLGNDNALELFSFASTFTSIILSVLAIMMTINSEEKNERVKNSVDISIQELSKSSDEMKKYNRNILQIEKKMAEINKISPKLDNKLEEIKNISKELSDNSKGFKDMLAYQKEILKHIKSIDRNVNNQNIEIDEIDEIDIPEGENNE